MLFRLSALKVQSGKRGGTRHPDPPPQGGRERCGGAATFPQLSSPISSPNLLIEPVWPNGRIARAATGGEGAGGVSVIAS